MFLSMLASKNYWRAIYLQNIVPTNSKHPKIFPLNNKCCHLSKSWICAKNFKIALTLWQNSWIDVICMPQRYSRKFRVHGYQFNISKFWSLFTKEKDIEFYSSSCDIFKRMYQLVYAWQWKIHNYKSHNNVYFFCFDGQLEELEMNLIFFK